jgi:hypothetical protein
VAVLYLTPVFTPSRLVAADIADLKLSRGYLELNNNYAK